MAAESSTPNVGTILKVGSWGLGSLFSRDIPKYTPEQIAAIETPRLEAMYGNLTDDKPSPGPRIPNWQQTAIRLYNSRAEKVRNIIESENLNLPLPPLIGSVSTAPIAPPPIAPPPIAPPVMTSPPVVIEPAPRVVTGDVLTEGERLRYDIRRENARALETMRRFGGRGAVGGALQLGAALWAEFGAEILMENAAKEAAKAQAQRNENLRKGPKTRRAATAKKGRIRRATTPPGRPPDMAQLPKVKPRPAPRSVSFPDLEPIRIDAVRMAEVDLKAATKAGQQISTGTTPKTSSLTLSKAASVLSALAAGSFAGRTASQLVSNAEAVLVQNASKPDPQIQLQTSTGGAGNLYTETRTATGQKGEKCRVVCRKTGQKKKKKRSRKVCIDKGSLTKLFKSTLKGK